MGCNWIRGSRRSDTKSSWIRHLHTNDNTNHNNTGINNTTNNDNTNTNNDTILLVLIIPILIVLERVGVGCGCICHRHVCRYLSVCYLHMQSLWIMGIVYHTNRYHIVLYRVASWVLHVALGAMLYHRSLYELLCMMYHEVVWCHVVSVRTVLCRIVWSPRCMISPSLYILVICHLASVAFRKPRYHMKLTNRLRLSGICVLLHDMSFTLSLLFVWIPCFHTLRYKSVVVWERGFHVR